MGCKNPDLPPGDEHPCYATVELYTMTYYQVKLD